MSFFIEDPNPHHTEHLDVEAKIYTEYGPFETAERAIEYWLSFNGGHLPRTPLKIVERS